MKRTKTEAKSTLTPERRFPEFRNDPGWEGKSLSTISDPISERADSQEQHNVLTLSGEHGLILQSEYFGKQVAGTNSDRYLRIRRDDFVYNDRTTKASLYGTIKRLKNQPHGIVSPIYKCFRFKQGQHPGFWEWYFESGAHEAQLRSLANEGARAGRFNVSIDRFLSTTVFSPNSDTAEQVKIAKCLSTLDELIDIKNQKFDALKAHKNWLVLQLFPRKGETLPRLRFPKFQGAWDESTLGSLSTNISSGKDKKNPGGSFDLYGSTGTIGKTSCETFTGSFLLVARVGANAGFLTKASGSFGVTDNTLVIDLIDKKNNDFIFQYLSSLSLNNLIFGSGQPLITGGQLKALPILLPCKSEREDIVSCLSSLDALIAAQRDELSNLKTHKQALMQQLFPSPAEAEA